MIEHFLFSSPFRHISHDIGKFNIHVKFEKG